ncbi:MAG: citrate (Si)-synthase [Candidatus Neomarinimicrobiota bacterium]
MSILQTILEEKVPLWRKEKKDILTKYGKEVISEVTVSQAYGGMRGIKGMICDTSVVEPDKGLIVRGHPLLQIKEIWPEEVFHLLVTGEMPDEEAKRDLQEQLAERSDVPSYVWDVLRAMPKDSHPMCMLDTGILVMERQSAFRKAYDEEMKKTEYWVAMLEDAFRLLGALPGIAAGVYRIRFSKGDIIPYDKSLDWGANFARMLGIDDPTGNFAKLIRLYLTLHCDHEGGNVSANTCHTVGSVLSDPFYAVSAGLNGLAGPLHGLANQECLKWILELMEKFNGIPTEEQVSEMAFHTLRAGKVIPGYGHAVLRVTDPRFTGLNDFGHTHLPDDPVFRTVDTVFRVVPGVLEEYSKERVAAGKSPIANFWPNVDAGSGALLYHYGVKEFEYYTVFFSVSRAMGMLAQLIVNRALGTPITRPKSVSAQWVNANV